MQSNQLPFYFAHAFNVPCLYICPLRNNNKKTKYFVKRLRYDTIRFIGSWRSDDLLTMPRGVHGNYMLIDKLLLRFIVCTMFSILICNVNRLCGLLPISQIFLCYLIIMWIALIYIQMGHKIIKAL